MEQWHGTENIGSSRIRGHWLVKAWSESEIFQQGADYEVVIFQKAYWLEYAKLFKGIKILDICDPDWLDTTPVKDMIDECDAVTTSTEALRDEIKKFTDKPVVYIPDRQDLEFFNTHKVHEGKAKKVVWFGYSHNAEVLDRAIGVIRRNELELTVISDARPAYVRADKNLKYDINTFSKIMLEHDFAILPKDNRPRGKFKSPNKTYTSWALGMPVATTPEEMERFIDPIERTKEAEKRLKEVREKWDTKQSVEEFKKLINEIKKGRKIIK